MKLLVLNKSHYVEEADVFRVQFQTIQQFDKQQMCLVNLNLFNSFSNVSSELSNNRLSVFWPNGGSHDEFQLTMPDGFYSANATFLAYLTEAMAAEGVAIGTNIVVARNQSWQTLARFTKPSGESLTPYLVFGSSSLASKFGYSTLQIGTGSSSTETIYSDVASAEHSANSLLVTCNLLHGASAGVNRVTNLLTSVPIAGASYGGIISKQAPRLQWVDITGSHHSELVLELYSELQERLRMVDTNMLFVLAFRDRP
jgi:hypothetical protein